jgi:hypothetical protein
MQSLAEVLATIPDKILLTEKAVEPHGDSWEWLIALDRLSSDAPRRHVRFLLFNLYVSQPFS